MKLLHTNDWHFAAKNPKSRTDDYNEELFTSLDNLFKLVVALKVSAICIAGDLFHDKDRALPWSVLTRLLAWGQRIRAQGCVILMIRGNHDLKYDRFESVEQTPYGVLMASGTFQDISRRSVLIGGDDGTQGRPGAIWVYGLPWPDGGGPDAYQQVPSDAYVVLAHGWSTPEGEPRYGNWCVRYDDLAKGSPHVQLWHFGHDHSDHGVYTCKNGAKMINIGALSRGSLDADSINRDVKVAVSTWSDDGRLQSVEQVKLPVPPANEIFDLTARMERAKEQQALEQFVASFRANLTGMTMVQYEDVLAQTPLDAAVRAKVEQYLQNAEGVV